jgi:hypothetical protein
MRRELTALREQHPFMFWAFWIGLLYTFFPAAIFVYFLSGLPKKVE